MHTEQMSYTETSAELFCFRTPSMSKISNFAQFAFTSLKITRAFNGKETVELQRK